MNYLLYVCSIHSSSLISEGFDEDDYEYIYLYYQCDYCLFHFNSILKFKATVSYLNRFKIENYMYLYFICRPTIRIIEKGYFSRKLLVFFPLLTENPSAYLVYYRQLFLTDKNRRPFKRSNVITKITPVCA